MDTRKQLLLTDQRLFISYAKEDKARVMEIYHLLQAEGFKPWIDAEDLVAGQDWDMEIRKAIKGAKLFLVMLSHSAVSKTGYFQKEIREALDAADSLPEGSVFIVPIKLDECAVPERVGRWQWIEVFSPIDYPKLIRTLGFYIGEEQRTRRKGFPDNAWPARHADKEFARMCMENGVFIHGHAPDGRIAISDKRIMMLRPKLGATLSRLQDSKSLSQEVSTIKIQKLLATVVNWQKHPVIHEKMTPAKVVRMQSEAGITAWLNPRYLSIVRTKFPKAKAFILGNFDPVVFGDEKAGRIDALVMPRAEPEKNEIVS